MTLLAKKSDEEFERELPPEDTILARCIWVIDLGTQHSDKFDKWIHQVSITWELDEKMESGEPFVISRQYTLSLGDKASLRKDLEAWRGKAFTEDELSQGFDLKKLLLQWCMITVVYNVKDNKTYANIASIMRPDKNTRQVLSKYNKQPHNTPIYFEVEDWRDDTFQLIPEWLQNKIKDSAEYDVKLSNVGHPEPDYNPGEFEQDNEPPPLDEQDIPF